MIKTLYIFANMGHLDELPKSGGQTSARRVMQGLSDAGFEIIPIRRHRNECEGIFHWIEKMFFAFFDPVKIFLKLLLGNRASSAFLHLTYAGPLVPLELWISLIARISGYRCLTYLKGGQIVDFYAKGSFLHKKLFKLNMDLQSKVFFEGMESLDLVKPITRTPLVYFPNYIFEKQIPDEIAIRPSDSVNLLYFGRIAPNKNVHIILDAFDILCRKYDNIHLTLIGGIGQSKAYADEIDSRIKNSKYYSKIRRMGNTPFEKIKDIMQEQHFFVFPSKEPCEGHSNSLNEAMSQGLVPIVSDYHFNKSIVNEDLLVINNFDATSYAETISKIIENHLFEKLSHAMWMRIKNNYTYQIVNERIVKEIQEI